MYIQGCATGMATNYFGQGTFSTARTVWVCGYLQLRDGVLVLRWNFKSRQWITSC